MKWIFWLLLLGNAALFGYAQLGGASSGESMRGHEPLQADKVRLLGIAPPAKPKIAKPAPQVCLEWGAFDADQLAGVRQALDSLQLGGKLSEREVIGNPRYWVLIPPLKSPQEADKKLSQLKDLGVEEMALVQDNDKLRNAISLGIFSSEEAAKKHLDALREKGVRSAKVEMHGKAAKRTSFYVHDASEALFADLVRIKQDFPVSELKAIACEAVTNPQPEEKK